MINIHELTTDHKIKLKKPMGCFDNLGEACEIVKIDTDENVINFRFGVDGVHLGVMSGDELEKYLNENGIGTVKHYPIPMHLQEAYKDLNIKEGSLPIAEEISKTVLSIPMYYGMTDEEVNYVIDKLIAFK